MRNDEVIKAFLSKKEASSSTGNLSSTGDRLFSYQTCIAQFTEDGIILNKTKYSTTTSRHLNSLEYKIAGHIVIFHVFDIAKGTQFLYKP